MWGARGRQPGSGGRISVWDAATRLFHWLLAGLVMLDLVRDDGGPLHRQAGYVAVGVVLARLTWAARTHGAGGFAALRPSLMQTIAYLRNGAPRAIAHDPLGIWMVWLLWCLVLLLGLSGWVSR